MLVNGCKRSCAREKELLVEGKEEKEGRGSRCNKVKKG